MRDLVVLACPCRGAAVLYEVDSETSVWASFLEEACCFDHYECLGCLSVFFCICWFSLSFLLLFLLSYHGSLVYSSLHVCYSVTENLLLK